MKQSPLFGAADILLPDFHIVDGTKWSAVACDQYTSQPEYWQAADELVGGAPSTLRLMLPEAWLGESDTRTPGIHAAMRDCLDRVLISHPDSMILLERTLADGSIRRGLVGLIDLESYDYTKGASSLIRATEETVPERIPARMTIRRDALIELPHVMLLIDDREKTVIEPLFAGVSAPDAYDYDLMQQSGHIRGWFLPEEAQKRTQKALRALVTSRAMTARYRQKGLAPLLFAVGDGNHSLAAAKACWEEIKAGLTPKEAAVHPARFALAEVVNLYDESLIFEPIYRIVFGVQPDAFLADLTAYTAALEGTMPAQTLPCRAGDAVTTVTVPHPVSALAVGTVQQFLNEYVKSHPGVSVDYIHGADTAAALAQKPGTVAVLFDGMKKEELFATVISDGALPRKTFSMGHAQDKRFYCEARKIR